MRDDDGRKLDHQTLEQLRMRAVGSIEQGAHPEDVAAALGMTRAAVYGWLANYREAGWSAQGPPGPRTAADAVRRPAATGLHPGCRQ
jgi:transposase